MSGLVMLLPAAVQAEATKADPWSKAELIEPADLVKKLSAASRPHIFCVTFPLFYRQKHIPHAVLAGPTNKPEGVAELRKAVEKLPRNSEVVVYCGCCPMKDCPNIRPAYTTLKEMGFKHVRVLELSTNFHADWVVKGYPVET